MKKKSRPYRLGARAEAAARTREAILDAAWQLFWERDPDDFTLDDVAAGAGVTVQTVLRKFGSKDGLFKAGLRERGGRTVEERRPAAADAKSAVVALVASYEQMGDANWRMLRHEHRQPLLAEAMAHARAQHRGWIADSFGFALPPRGSRRERMIDALFTALDFYVWKLHRRDLGRTRRQTEAVMLELVTAIIEKEARNP